MKEIMKNAGILFAITLIAGLLLGVVNDVTKEPIAKKAEEAAKEAMSSVFLEDTANGLPGADSYTELSFSQSKVESILSMAGLDAESVDAMYEAKDASGNLLGYVFGVTSKEGYAGEISFTMGIRLDGTLNGICLTTINETVGLGMNAEEVLVPQFAGKRVTSFEYTKMGAMADNQVDAITSATYTTNAIVNGVNAGLCVFEQIEEVKE